MLVDSMVGSKAVLRAVLSVAHLVDSRVGLRAVQKAASKAVQRADLKAVQLVDWWADLGDWLADQLAVLWADC